jgi:hypothetical protein
MARDLPRATGAGRPDVFDLRRGARAIRRRGRLQAGGFGGQCASWRVHVRPPSAAFVAAVPLLCLFCRCVHSRQRLSPGTGMAAEPPGDPAAFRHSEDCLNEPGSASSHMYCCGVPCLRSATTEVLPVHQPIVMRQPVLPPLSGVQRSFWPVMNLHPPCPVAAHVRQSHRSAVRYRKPRMTTTHVPVAAAAARPPLGSSARCKPAVCCSPDCHAFFLPWPGPARQ